MNYIQLQLSSLNTNNLSNIRSLQAVQNACLRVIKPNLLLPHIPKLTYLPLILVCRQLFPTNILLLLHIKLENLTTKNVLKICVDEKIFWRLKICNPDSSKLLNNVPH